MYDIQILENLFNNKHDEISFKIWKKVILFF